MNRKVAVIVVIAMLACGPSYAQDLAAMLAGLECPEQRECPPRPPFAVCDHLPGWDISLHRGNGEPTDVITLRETCGERVIDGVIVGCPLIVATTKNSLGIVSEERTMAYGGDQCVTVPEPAFPVSIALGYAAILALRRRRFLNR